MKKRFSPEFQAQVALAALRNEETFSELAKKYEVHPTQINRCRQAGGRRIMPKTREGIGSENVHIAGHQIPPKRSHRTSPSIQREG